MSRLIEADATIVAFERAGLELGARGRIEEAANYFIAARILRESALPKHVEVEPVVHCKDCKNFKEYTPEFKKSAECVEGADGDCITRALYSDAHPQFSAVRKCDYCSNGEKMDLEG